MNERTCERESGFQGDRTRQGPAISTQHTRPAGATVRSIATGIDFLIVTLVALLVTLPFGAHSVDGYVGNALALVYGTLCLARWGTTGGKALLELEVVSTADGQRPTLPQAFVRETTMLGPTVALAIIAHYSAYNFDLAVAIVAGLTFLSLVHAAWRVPGKRAPWDRVSGTQVRYRASRRPSAALLP